MGQARKQMTKCPRSQEPYESGKKMKQKHRGVVLASVEKNLCGNPRNNDPAQINGVEGLRIHFFSFFCRGP